MTKDRLETVVKATVAGLPIANLDLEETAALMVELAVSRPRGERPLFLTSANGEVIARCKSDPKFAETMRSADLVSADGQPLVFASRLFCASKLPERVATTDLFDHVARRAEASGVSFYLFGATEAVNRRTYDVVRRKYPQLRILGRCHGYLHEGELENKIEEINALAPDVLWIALGVPLEQAFVGRWSDRLLNVGMIKTSGGLFDFVSRNKKRAPLWMRNFGLEWLFRIFIEPRRMFWRYFLTNPVAIVELIRSSQ